MDNTLRVWSGVFLAIILAGGVYGQTIPPDTEFRVRLLSPVSTDTNRKGDQVNAQVLSPDSFAGDIMQGVVTTSKGSNKIKGKSTLKFKFRTLQHGDAQIPITSAIRYFFNSKGQMEADEEGQVIQKTNNTGKIAAASTIGALVGLALGGAQGMAIGSGVGAVGSLAFLKFAVRGPRISFGAGSEFVVVATQAKK